MRFFLPVLIFFCFVFSLPINAQLGKTLRLKKGGGKFYKTYEDFKNETPIENIALLGQIDLIRGWSIQVKRDGKEEKLKDSEIPYEWFVDYFGNLIRVYKKEMYYVIADGPICYFVRCREANVITTNTERIIFSPRPDEIFKEYYSDKIDGEIIRFKDKMFDEFIEKYGLKEQFDSDKLQREMKDSVLDYKNKEWNKRYKYKLLINEKMK